jgi:hypothetical protein
LYLSKTSTYYLLFHWEYVKRFQGQMPELKVKN